MRYWHGGRGSKMARTRYNRREVDLFKPCCADDPYGDVWKWVRDRLANCQPHLWPAVMCEYVAVVNEAFYDELAEAKKSNAAMRAGNIYMRNIERDSFNIDHDAMARLNDIMEVGPPRKCSTCTHWRNDSNAPIGEPMQGCRLGDSDNVRGICEKWDSRV